MYNLNKVKKRQKKILVVIGTGLSHKDNIYKSSYIINKWYEVQILYLWFYQIKHLVNDWFDNISVGITNNGEDIDLD